MNKVADTVLKNMQEKQKEDDEKIRRYEMEKELRERVADERRAKKHKNDQHNMRDFLHKQMEEKKRKEGLEKALNDEQAAMWRTDLANYTEEERRLYEKIHDINKDNAEFLKLQIEGKHAKDKRRMNKAEF